MNHLKPVFYSDIYQQIQDFLPRKEILRTATVSKEWFESGVKALFDQLFAFKNNSYFHSALEKHQFKKWNDQQTVVINLRRINLFFRECMNEMRHQASAGFSEEKWQLFCPKRYQLTADFSDIAKMAAEDEQTLVRFFEGFMSENSDEVYCFLHKNPNLTVKEKTDYIKRWLVSFPKGSVLDLGQLHEMRFVDLPLFPVEALSLVYFVDARLILQSSAANGHFNTFVKTMEFGTSGAILGAALLWAAKKGHLDIVKILLVSDNFDSIRTNDLIKAFNWAAEYEHLEVITLLWNCQRFREVSLDDLSAELDTVIRDGRIRVVEEFRKYGLLSLIDSENEGLYGALNLAEELGRVEITAILKMARIENQWPVECSLCVVN